MLTHFAVWLTKHEKDAPEYVLTIYEFVASISSSSSALYIDYIIHRVLFQKREDTKYSEEEL
jgi:hypothetical protein